MNTIVVIGTTRSWQTWVREMSAGEAWMNARQVILRPEDGGLIFRHVLHRDELDGINVVGVIALYCDTDNELFRALVTARMFLRAPSDSPGNRLPPIRQEPVAPAPVSEPSAPVEEVPEPTVAKSPSALTMKDRGYKIYNPATERWVSKIDAKTGAISWVPQEHLGFVIRGGAVLNELLGITDKAGQIFPEGAQAFDAGPAKK